jgi:hypothetical protein
MKTPLDLTCEFAALDDAKTRCKGHLPPSLEKRWVELKGFYDMLMAWNGVPERPAIQRYTAAEIRRKLTCRERLRVPAEMDIFFNHRGLYHTARLVNLSCGGVLLTADTRFDLGSRLTLYLIKFDRGGMPFIRTDGEVVWNVGARLDEAEPPDKMGVRFIELGRSVLEELDSFVIEILEQQLGAFDARALAPELVCQEHIIP